MAPSRLARRLSTAATALALTGTALAAGPSAGASANPITHPDQDHKGWSLAARAGSAAPATVSPAVAGLPGLDVSSHQGNVDWTSVKNNGAKFAYA